MKTYSPLTWAQVVCGFGGRDWEIACEACGLTEKPQIHERSFQSVEDVSNEDYADMQDGIFGGDWRAEAVEDELNAQYYEEIDDDPELELFWWYASSDAEYATEVVESFDSPSDDVIEDDEHHEVQDELAIENVKDRLLRKEWRLRKREFGGYGVPKTTRKPGRRDKHCWKTYRSAQHYRQAVFGGKCTDRLQIAGIDPDRLVHIPGMHLLLHR